METHRPIAVDDEEAWLALATRTAHVAVCVSRPRDARVIEVNDAFCRLFQYERAQLLSHSATELGLWADPAQRERLLARLQQHGHVSGFEARYRNGLGEEGDMLVSATLVERGGQTYVVAFLNEVSDQRELLDGLRAAQARFGVVLRATGLLVFSQDRELRYTWVANPALGVTSSDLIGRTDDDVLGPERALPLVAVKRRVLATGQAERRDVWVATNGQLACFDLVVEPDFDATGQVRGIVCAAMDITQRVVAHRASAPVQSSLQTIRGLASLLDREGLSPRQVQRLQGIRRAAGRIEAEPPDAEPPLDALRQRHAGTLVMVAEQNEVLREATVALLEAAGLRVVAVGNGVEAFSLSLQLGPALLLLDMELPQRGGVAAARALRATAPQPPVIVAMVSCQPQPDAAHALDADLDDVIDKPVQADGLYAKVLSWLDNR